jgi:hypothetical protein
MLLQPLNPRNLATVLLNRKNRVPKFTRTIRCQFYGDEIVQSAKKTLDKLGKVAPDGVRYYEGKRYSLWQKEEILTITAKDNRGEILRFENGEIGGYLSSADVEAILKKA